MINIFINILNIIFLTILFLLIGYNIMRLTDCFVTLRKGKFYKIIALIGLSFTGSVVILISDMVNISWTLTGYTVLMLLCYKDNFIRKISVIVILYPIIVSINMFFSELIVRILLPRLDILIMVLNVAKLTIIALIWQSIYIIMKDKVIYAKEYITNKIWILIDIISLASFALALSMVIFTEHTARYQAYIVMPTCLISNLAILFTIKLVIQSVKIKEDNNILKIQSQYYSMLETEQKNIRKIRHDMNNHIQIINTYINDNNFEEAKEYLESLSSAIHSTTSKIFCNNDIINAVINNKYICIKENNIKSEISMAMNNISTINSMDLCSIFANTFDNAIEACKKIDEPSQRCITAKARYDKGYFTYNIKNSKCNDILTDSTGYITDKDDKKFHGFGLQNVMDIVKKYNGDMEINHTNNDFSVVIIIPV